MHISCRQIDTIPEFIDSIRLRADVFIREQGLPFDPEPEAEDEDKVSRHFVGDLKGRIVSTARLRESGPSELMIERMVTHKDYRGRGIGEELLGYILSQALRFDPARIWLRTQVRSQTFFGRNGFYCCSEPFDIWGIPHVEMNHRPKLITL